VKAHIQLRLKRKNGGCQGGRQQRERCEEKGSTMKCRTPGSIRKKQGNVGGGNESKIERWGGVKPKGQDEVGIRPLRAQR